MPSPGLTSLFADDFRKGGLQYRPDGGIGHGEVLRKRPVAIRLVVDAIDVVAVDMEVVVAKLEADILYDQQTGGHAKRKAGDIDGGKDFLAP